MDILIFTSEFIPFPGGVASHSVSLAYGLNKLGHNITIITKKYKKYGMKMTEIDTGLRRIGIKCIRLLFIKKVFIFIWRFKLKSHLKKNNYDLIILNDIGSQLVMSKRNIF